MSKVIVIGGGIAGLTAAFRLRESGCEVLILEEQECSGGNIRTKVFEDFRLELGPSSFMGSSEMLWHLITELGIEDRVEAASASSNNRYILRDGRLSPLPMSAISFITTPLLSLKAKLRLACEPFVRGKPDKYDTAWDFFVRRFGEEAATYIMSPFVSGIYAGDVKKLGARAAFPLFWQFEQDAGSMILGARKYLKKKRKRLLREGLPLRKGLFNFRGGLGYVTTKLAQNLSEQLVTSCPVETLSYIPNSSSSANAKSSSQSGYVLRSGERQFTADAVILAIPPDKAGPLLGQILPQGQQIMSVISMSPVMLVHWTPQEDSDYFPSGFGFLVPRLYDLRVLGTIFASQLFTERSPKDRCLFSSFYGGTHDVDALNIPDEDIPELVMSEHQRIFGRNLKPPRILKVYRYPTAIPQLGPEHLENIAALTQHITTIPGLFLAGNYLSGVGIEHAVSSGYRSATECESFLQNKCREQ
jgi:oxygen-dependent protoporphyrinogen oxidase